MASQPHNPANPPDTHPMAPEDQAHPTHPGGMASDPAAALANEIITNLKGAPDRFRTHVENTPALKAMMDQINADLTSGIANSIRSLINNEVAKVTGGMGAPKVVPPADSVSKK